MKTRLYLTIVLCAIVNISFSQNNGFSIAVNNKTFELPPGNRKADFSKEIILSFSGKTVPANIDFELDGAELKLHKKNDYTFIVKENQTDPVNITFNANGYTKNSISIINNKPEINSEKENDTIPNSTTNRKTKKYEEYHYEYAQIKNTYDRENNMAFYYFDEKGLLLSLAPVNVDADDYIVVSMIVPEVNDISIQVVGEYNAVDLNIKPYEAITPDAHSNSDKTTKYIVVTKTFGPFTSEKAIIKFFDGSTEITNNLEVRINKLYNVAIGASFVSSDLEKPEFDIFQIPGTTTNTINTVNGGKRTLATFNVIFYWKASVDWVLGKLEGKSHITRGRDILKEATFWERLNPTFGVAINSEWKENFFFGGNFEFARGGSISAGWHYGKVQKLADNNFRLGTDVYTGTKDEIRLTDTWKTGFFFGITLDTRIFNKVWARN